MGITAKPVSLNIFRKIGRVDVWLSPPREEMAVHIQYLRTEQRTEQR